MELFRIEVGHDADVQPGNIVGAIANEAGLDAENIGHIDIRDKFSLIELPEGMPKAVFNDLKKVWVRSQKLDISRVKTSSDDFTVSTDILSESGSRTEKIGKVSTGKKRNKKRKKKVPDAKGKEGKRKRKVALNNSGRSKD